ASYTRTYYDGAASLTTAPIKGDATKVETLLASEGRWLASTMTYDGLGNRLSVTDPLGHTTTTTYDPTYRVYPVTQTNALGHTTTTAWDHVCAAPLSVTDPNDAITRTTYDTRCRRTRLDQPDGSWVLWTHYDSLRGHLDGGLDDYHILERRPDGTSNYL